MSEPAWKRTEARMLPDFCVRNPNTRPRIKVIRRKGSRDGVY
jgi:hypothetical protein